IGADPDLRPRRRNCEGVDALSLAPVGDARALRQIVGPAGADALSRDSARLVGDVAQPGAGRRGSPMRDAGAPVFAQTAARMHALRISIVHLSMSRPWLLCPLRTSVPCGRPFSHKAPRKFSWLREHFFKIGG